MGLTAKSYIDLNFVDVRDDYLAAKKSLKICQIENNAIFNVNNFLSLCD